MKRSTSLLMRLGRIVLFVVSIVVALGWLVAPQEIAKQRDRVAAFVRLPTAATSRGSAPAPQAVAQPATIRSIAAHVH